MSEHQTGLKIEMDGDLPALFAALAAAQQNIAPIIKDSSSTAFKGTTKYASLSSTVSSIVPALSAQGIAVMQFPHDGADGRNVRIATMLAHKSGGWIRATLSLPLTAVSAQGMGSAITYGRRYTLLAIAAQAPEDDDDGAEATAQAPRQAAKPTASRQIEHEAPPVDDVPAVRREMAEKSAAEIIRRLGIAESPEDVTEILHAAGGVLARLEAGYPDLRQSVREAETQAKRRVAPANGANGHHPDGIAV